MGSHDHGRDGSHRSRHKHKSSSKHKHKSSSKSHSRQRRKHSHGHRASSSSSSSSSVSPPQQLPHGAPRLSKYDDACVLEAIRRWTLRHREKQWESLDLKHQQQFFLEFRDRWNQGILSADYYRMFKINPEAAAAGPHIPEHVREKMSNIQREQQHDVNMQRRKEMTNFQQDAIDAMCPKPDPGSFQARVAKRKAKAGASGRESPTEFFVDQELSAVQDNSGIQKAVARIRHAREKKQFKMLAKVQKHKEEERAKMQALLASVGMKGGLSNFQSSGSS